jgi:cysteine-rich repeat protein
MAGERYALLALLVACVQSQSVPCGDGFTCPEATVCRTLTEPMQRLCASQDQIDACEGRAEFDECTLDDVAIARCYQGVCLEAGCGNLRVDPDEACDDGNAVVGDGCSFACQSNETCGNTIVDPAKIVEGITQPNEQCDDGNPIGRDGCASTCATESAAWEQLVLGKPAPRLDAAMVFDAARRRVVMFGGAFRGTAQQFDARNDTWEWDGRGWISVPTAVAPAVRYGHVMVYDAARHRTILFGGTPAGTDSSAILDDTWEFDGARWILLAPQPSPPGRAHAAAVYDSIRERAMLFGGIDETGALLDDMWLLDGDAWTRLDAVPRPAARSGHAMAFDPRRGVTVLAGGSSTLDTWEFDGAAWRDVTPVNTADRLPQSSGVDLAYDPTTRQVIARSGLDTWGWNGTVWTKLATGTEGVTSPRAPFSPALVTDPVNGNVLHFGGYRATFVFPGGFQYTTYDETWVWNGTAWNEVVPAVPASRQLFASVYDSARGRLVMFGGASADFTTYYDETWELGTTHWRQYATTPSPGARYGASMVFDSTRGVSVLFGGEGAPTPVGTWIWNGTQWSNASPATSPPERYGAAFAFDPVRGRAVLFGGYSFGLGIGDTWEWDGSTWHEMTPTTSPAIRAHAAATFDPIRRRVVLFGGSSSQTAYRDAWEWDGTNWSMIASATAPSARSTAALAWYAPRRRLALFAGRAGVIGVGLSDTWELDASSWKQLIPEVVPPGRAGHTLIPTLDGAGMLSFGGNIGSTVGNIIPTNEVWRLRFRSGQRYELCALDQDRDGDGLAGCADPDCWAACSPLCPPGVSCEPSWPRCGDGTCSGTETCRICPMDCTCTAVCGDTFCDPPETAATCAGDCG